MASEGGLSGSQTIGFLPTTSQGKEVEVCSFEE